MASFGRAKLMAVTIRRFLTQLKRHDEPAQARLFADARARRRRQRAAEDLHFVIDRFADRDDLDEPFDR